MIQLHCTIDEYKELLDLAQDIVSYNHHSGYPNYDGGHSEPESECPHPKCALIRKMRNESNPEGRLPEYE